MKKILMILFLTLIFNSSILVSQNQTYYYKHGNFMFSFQEPDKWLFSENVERGNGLYLIFKNEALENEDNNKNIENLNENKDDSYYNELAYSFTLFPFNLDYYNSDFPSLMIFTISKTNARCLKTKSFIDTLAIEYFNEFEIKNIDSPISKKIGDNDVHIYEFSGKLKAFYGDLAIMEADEDIVVFINLATKNNIRIKNKPDFEFLINSFKITNDKSKFADDYNYNLADTLIYDGTIEQLEHAFKYNSYNEVRKYLDYYASENKPISEKDLKLKTPIEQETYKLFIAFHNTHFLSDSVNRDIEEFSYKFNIKHNKCNYLIIQPEILVRITDYVKYKSSKFYRSKIINKDTLYEKILSSMILINFYPDLQIENKKIIYSDYRLNKDILTFLRNPSYNNYPVLDNLAERKLKFLKNVVPLNIYPARVIQLNSEPFINHIDFNKELNTARVYFSVEGLSTISIAVFNKIDGKWQFIKHNYMYPVN